MSARPVEIPGTAQDAGGEPRLSFKERLARAAHLLLAPLSALLVRVGVSPDHLTVAGVVCSILAGLFFFEGAFRWGALLVAFSGICDILDGEVARRSGRRTAFGAFLDSTLDRLADAAVLMGLAGFYLQHLMEQAASPVLLMSDMERGLLPRTWAIVSLTAVLAMVGSFLVSYTRARAEGLGLECRVGFFERPERMVVIIVAGAFGVGPVMSGALVLLALLSFVTAGQRVAHVWKQTRSGPGGGS